MKDNLNLMRYLMNSKNYLMNAMTTKLQQKHNRAEVRAVEIQAAAEPAGVNLLFIGFVLTMLWTLVYEIVGNPMIDLYWIPYRESLTYITWICAINIYLAMLFHVLSVAYNSWLYKFISCCYIFGVIELFVVWDKPWFRLFGMPMTSNTLIIFGFFFHYANKKWRLTI